MTFETALNKFNLDAPDCVFDMVCPGSDFIATARRALHVNGVVLIRNAISEAASLAGRRAALNAWYTDIMPSLDPKVVPSSISSIYEVQANPKLWPTGTIGNKGFGFMYAQPESKDDFLRTPLVATDIIPTTFALGSGYQACMAVMEHDDSQFAMNAIFEIPDNVGGMMSQDSFKTLRGDFTIPHVDEYATSDQFNRIQAMAFGHAEGNVRLVFARGTHQPSLSKYFRDKSAKGFTSLSNHEQLVDVFEATGSLVIPQPGDLVLWKSGIVHFEMNIRSDRPRFKSPKKDKEVQERYVVGTHMPSLNQEQLTTLAHMAEAGFILHPYAGPKQQNAGAMANIFHRKNTQYCKRRKQTVDERKRFRIAASATITKPLSLKRRILYGLK